MVSDKAISTSFSRGGKKEYQVRKWWANRKKHAAVYMICGYTQDTLKDTGRGFRKKSMFAFAL